MGIVVPFPRPAREFPELLPGAMSAADMAAARPALDTLYNRRLAFKQALARGAFEAAEDLIDEVGAAPGPVACAFETRRSHAMIRAGLVLRCDHELARALEALRLARKREDLA